MSFSRILWVCLAGYLALGFYEIFRMFRPVLVVRRGEVIFTPSWRTAGVTTHANYAWTACISASADTISAREMAEQCVFDRRDLTLMEGLKLRDTAAVPTTYFTEPIKRQEAYAALHAEYVGVTKQLEKHSQPRETGDELPSAQRSVLNVRRASLAKQLSVAKQHLIASQLHLHSFFWRVDTGGMLTDPYHVHTSTPLLARVIVPQNHTRSLLGGPTNQPPTTAVATTNQTLTPSDELEPSTKLIFHLKPKVAFQFVSEALVFPASSVPPELAHHFTRKEKPGQRSYQYAPIIAPQEFFALRREWLSLNQTWIEEVAAQETKGPELIVDGETVFSTTAAVQAGVSDVAPVAVPVTPAVEVVAVGPFSTSGVTLHMSLDATSLGWYRLLAQLGQSAQLFGTLASQIDELQQQATTAAGGSARDAAKHANLLAHTGLNEDAPKELEDLKSMFIDTNAWLLLLTFLVSLLHMVLDFLALQADIKFWRGKREFVGVSARSIVISTAVRTILFLYLVDQEASRVVLVSAAFSLLVNYWKSWKLLRISFGLTKRFPFVLSFGEQPKVESKTAEIDAQAMRYLGYAALPFVIGASIYSLRYAEHKSWYSWVLSSIASAMYAGGFILMTPQLFINYRLKSVAHLPVRVFVYRACNTFIDDLFAWIIVMPTMHRLACFRDDIIFLVYMYQRWIYPVDASRTAHQDEDDADSQPPIVDAAVKQIDDATAAVSSESTPATAPSEPEASAAILDTPDDAPIPAETELTRRHNAQHAPAANASDQLD